MKLAALNAFMALIVCNMELVSSQPRGARVNGIGLRKLQIEEGGMGDGGMDDGGMDGGMEDGGMLIGPGGEMNLPANSTNVTETGNMTMGEVLLAEEMPSEDIPAMDDDMSKDDKDENPDDD